jgi:hypothetical protein
MSVTILVAFLGHPSKEAESIRIAARRGVQPDSRDLGILRLTLPVHDQYKYSPAFDKM